MSQYQSQTNYNRTNWIIFGITLLVIVIIVISLRSYKSESNEKRAEASIESFISAQEKSFDFGTISMAKGVVIKSFNITNPTAKSLTIGKVYTSCMCTKATLVINGERIGPIGMQGHGVVPELSEIFKSGDNAIIEVQYDPAAHGPSGVGRISRDVYVETTDGGRLDLKIDAEVTP